MIEGSSVYKAKPFWRRAGFWLFIVSVAYISFLVSMATLRSVCPQYDPGQWSSWYDPLWLYARYLECRPLGTLGDFLAGAFAPLAFIWIATAVFLQSRELTAQRRELQLARDEARQTREVLAQQAAESRASAQFIGKQTEILEKRQLLREQAQADEQFDEMLKAFVSFAADAEWVTIGHHIEHSGNRPDLPATERVIKLVSLPNAQVEPTTALLQTYKDTNFTLQLLNEVKPPSKVMFVKNATELIGGLAQVLKPAVDMVPSLSAVHRASSASRSVGLVHRTLLALRDRVAALNRKHSDNASH